MASGKKGKKNKGKTLALTDFLQETPTQPIRKTLWSDEVDEYDKQEAKIVNVVLPTAPKASRDTEDISSTVPKDPPYMAYLSNLPYDVDEDEIAAFFKNMRIANMRIPKDDRSGEVPKLKGFGYVEFEDRDSLLSALLIPDTTLKNRRIRIEVASNADNDRRRGGRMGDRMGGDTSGDWRSVNRPEASEERRERGAFTREGMRDSRDRDGGFSRDREITRDREGGLGREREGGFGRDREGGFGRERDSGFNRNRDQDDRAGAWRDGDRQNRDSDRDRGFSRPGYRDSDRNSRFEDRDDRRGGFNRRYEDRDERNGGMTRSSNRGDQDDRESEPANSETRQRPKLQLAPRSRPMESHVDKAEPAAPSASIFGDAKPVDTSERERQIEEKLRKEQADRLGDGSRDKREKDREEGGDRRNIERGRLSAKRDDRENNIKNIEPTSGDKENELEEHNRKPIISRTDRSPDKKKNERIEKSKGEEKREKPEKDMPKLQEPEPPNFAADNKFAFLPEDNCD